VEDGTDAMSSPLTVIDGLMRELRTLRDDARPLDPTFTRPVVAEVARLIEHAAQAVDETIGDPENEVLLTWARRAIVEARERIQALKIVVSRPAEIVGIRLRRESTRRPYGQMATERKPA
jgi:hypothetical protein